MKYAIDVSNFSGTPTLETLSALVNSERIERIGIAIQFPDTYRLWYELAARLGLEIHAWLYLYEPLGWEQQLDDAIAQLSKRPAKALWLDMEDQRWQVTQPDIDGALSLVEAAEQPTGIYTAPGIWRSYGNPWAGERCPLWLAKWIDREPSETDFDVAFGGWERASMVQYRPEFTSYGLTVDLNVYE